MPGPYWFADSSSGFVRAGDSGDEVGRLMAVGAASPFPLPASSARTTPGPFDPAAAIRLAVPVESSVRIDVADPIEGLVAKLRRFPAGLQNVRRETCDLAAGMTVYRLTSESAGGGAPCSIGRKMPVVR